MAFVSLYNLSNVFPIKAPKINENSRCSASVFGEIYYKTLISRWDLRVFLLAMLFVLGMHKCVRYAKRESLSTMKDSLQRVLIFYKY